jgi:hypothetical protein
MNKNTEGKKNQKENKTDVLINSTFTISTITSVDKYSQHKCMNVSYLELIANIPEKSSKSLYFL